MNDICNLRDRTHIYSLKGDWDNFYTGLINGEKQLLAVVSPGSVSRMTFNMDGDLELADEFLLGETAHPHVFTLEDQQRFENWLVTVCFEASTIRVKRFFVPRFHIGISDFSAFQYNVLKNPNEYPQEAFDAAKRERERWMKEGEFLLWLGERIDFWMDKDGSILGT